MMYKRTILRTIDLISYSFFRLFGKPYSTYYAFRMDLIVKLNPDWGKNLQRKFQLDYLKSQGLTPNSVLLDYGCGALAAGRYFIDYLEPGHYIGADVSKGVLLEGRRRLEQLNLEKKGARLIHIQSNKPIGKVEDVDCVGSICRDAYAPEDLAVMISQIRQIMDRNTKFLFSFTLGSDGVRHRNFKDWEYDMDTITEISKMNGLNCEFQRDWKHPYDKEGTDKLVCLTLSKD